MTSAQISYPDFLMIIGPENSRDVFNTMAEVKKKIGGYDVDYIVARIDPVDKLYEDITEELALEWLDNASMDDEAPGPYAKYVDDAKQARRDERDDPRGRASEADAWRDQRNDDLEHAA